MAENATAGWFANGKAYETYMGRWSRAIAALFLDWLDLPAGLRWADIGCGTGALSAVILERAAPSRVVGIEPSENYLGLARAAVPDARAEFRSGGAEALPLEDAESDAAISGLVLNFVPDKARAAGEMYRVVAPGGTAASYVWDYSGGMQFLRFFWDAAVALFPDTAGSDEGSKMTICRPGPLEDLMRSAGFSNVTSQALHAPTMFADFDDFWSPFLLGQGPAGALCASLSDSDRARLRERLESAVTADPDGAIRLTARAWAVRGTR